MRRFVRQRGDAWQELGFAGSCSEGRLVTPHGEQTVEAVSRRSDWSLKLGDRMLRVEHLADGSFRVNGRELEIQLRSQLEHQFARYQKDGDEDGARRLEAPMPGRIVKLLVAEGDTVEKGQGLLIVEAMKMENELKAPASARVERILVTEGQGVEKGARLIELARD